MVRKQVSLNGTSKIFDKKGSLGFAGGDASALTQLITKNVHVSGWFCKDNRRMFKIII